MSLVEKIDEQFKTALKSKDNLSVSILRMLRSGIQNKEIEKRPDKLEEDDVVGIVMKLINQHKESIEQFKKGNREDLVKKEEDELKILEKFLPEQLSEEEIREKVKESIASVGAVAMKDMGKVMGELMPKLKGLANGKVISKITTEELSKLG